jgi:hypothetical protein
MPRRAWLCSTQFVEFRPKIRLAYERLANKQGCNPMVCKTGNDDVVFEAAFTHD